jgi:hypothetical protein
MFFALNLSVNSLTLCKEPKFNSIGSILISGFIDFSY